MLRVPRYGSGDVVRVCQDAPAGIKTDPACTGQIDFCPTVHRHAPSDLGRIHVPTHESRRKPQNPACFDKQGSQVSAGTRVAFDGFRWGLNAFPLPPLIFERVINTLVEMLQEFQCSDSLARVPIRSEPFSDPGFIPRIQYANQRGKFSCNLVIVNERIFLSAGRNNKIKRIALRYPNELSLSITRSLDFSVRSSNAMLFSYKSRVQ